MLLKEFEFLTGFYPTMDLFEVIHEAYMQSPDDTAAWCKNYVKNKNGIAVKIRDEADTRKRNQQIDADKKQKKLLQQIAESAEEQERLKKRIDKLEGWTPYLASRISDKDYSDLLNHDIGKFETLEDAKSWVCEEFGFSAEVVEVLEFVPEYEKSRDGRIRKTSRNALRKPAYNSTDWNYVRFDVHTSAGTFQWEVVNGDLYPYED